ncbi:hypothetical protein PRUPE_6G178500 [Prunus persica]|uniref:Nuclear speckle splicing regulatory protein 1 N-terminal domain-containing protein n=1 Tax=Prunus persica TaxID=3760 RepID=M5WBT1_PRUPE|nr:nuclear speckle splicing regulatory protein 1 [Prunus persica]ONI02125.1 hypothetical protein PRUPE_6G178500 [Prunus persica]
MSRYGLNLRPQQKKQPTRPPLPKPLGFGDDDDNDVEKEISRHASKNKSLKDIEEQQRKALEQDPSVFDYDGVYDEMKQKAIQPRAQDREERKPRYIQYLMKKAEERNREHEIVYERKLAKERTQEDHLYADKDKFVTSAYKRKLAEQAKWMEEERLRQLREEKDDVTKKKDLTDFYFNLGKNVAFGAEDAKSRKLAKQAELSKLEKHEDRPIAIASEPLESDGLKEGQLEKQVKMDKPEKHEDRAIASASELLDSPEVIEGHQEETLTISKSSVEPSDEKQASNTLAQDHSSVEQPPENQPKSNHHKRSEDALTAAKERYLARKRAKEQ